MKRLKQLAILVSILALLTACKEEKSTNPTNPDGSKILGYWNKDVSLFHVSIKFHENGDLTRVLLNGDEEIFGIYIIDDNTIIFKEGECGSEIVGKYTFTIDNDKLTFTLISDDCEDRVDSLTGGSWERGK